jgi:adenosine deaminase
VLHAERIDHGVAIAEDPALMGRAALERIPLTVCPTSNVVIANRYRSLAEHPLPAMRAAGLLVTINTDDPALEELDLGEEYRRVGDAFGLDVEALGELALEGIDSTWLDDSDRRALARDFEDRRGPRADALDESPRHVT